MPVSELCGRAAILCEQREPLIVDDIRIPSALDVGQVLVRVHYSGVCGSQVGEIDGVKGADRFLPHLLGHEGAATVLDVGPGVRRAAVGQRVVLHWRKAAGIECTPPTYGWRDRRVNAGWVTTFNELAIVSENRLTPIPEGLPLDVAALLGCPVTTAFGAVVHDARSVPGECCVVLGVGGVGLAVVQAARLAGAEPVVVLDRSESKLRLAERFGASVSIDSGAGDVNRALRNAVGARGADVVIETTGRSELIRSAYDLAASDGRVVLVGVPDSEDPVTLPTLPLHFGRVLTGSHGGSAVPERDVERLARLHRAGRLPLEELITERIGLADINDAIDALRRGAIVGRCVVEFGHPPAEPAASSKNGERS